MSKELREIVLSALAALLVAMASLALKLPAPLALLLTAVAALVLPLISAWHGRPAAIRARTREFIQRLIDVIPEPVYIKDKQSRYVMVNQAFAKHQRLQVGEVIGKSPDDIFMNPEYSRMVINEDAQVIAGHSVFKEEHKPNPVTGDERFQIVAKQACLDADGQQVIVGTNIDVTTWRQAERNFESALERETELRKRTQTFVQRLIDVIPDPVYVKNGESRFLMVNDAFARERRRAKSELVGLTSYDLAPSKAVGELAALEDQAVLAGGEVQKEQHTAMPVTGEECFRIVSKRRCVDADGNAVVVGAHFYITRFKVAERELQAALKREVERRERTQAYVQRLIDVIPQPVYVRDSESRYVMVNAAFVRERAMNQHEVLGHVHSELSDEDGYGVKSREEDLEVLAGKVVLKEEKDVHSVNGTERFRIISKQVCLDAEGQTVIVGANFDVTSWRVAEARWLQAKEVAEQSSAAKSLFLASMSHEIRTPLNGVIGTLRLALRDTSLQGTTLSYLRTSLSNAESLLSIISDILDFSKIEAGQLKIEKIDLELSSLVQEALQVFREHAALKSLMFSLNIDSDLPRYLRGDPTRIRQVLINLVGNAIKFTESGGVDISIRQQDDDDYSRVVFRVKDTGIGIPAEAVSRLFQKFQQADTSTTRRYGGTGLGLAICRQLVEAMGGEIHVTSQEGAGSTFEFNIPLEEGTALAPRHEAVLRKHSHRLSVLCAEDVAVNKIIVRALLEHMGHNIEIVDTGLEAIKALSQKNYDLVLMDGHMPEMNGQEAARAIRKGGVPGIQVVDPRVMMVALTADASLENQQQCLDAGMDAYLTKPIEERQLHAMLASAIVRQLERGAKLQPLSDEVIDITSEIATAAPTTHSSLTLRGMVDDDMTAELLPVFVKTISGTLSEIEVAISAQDFHKLADLFHSLKGSIGYFSDDQLYQRTVMLETAAKAQNPAAILQAFAPLRSALMGFVHEHGPNQSRH